jgi:isochorismate hydrolase
VEVNKAPFVPERSSLLVLDMQRYFLEPDSHAYIPSAPAIVPGICQLIRAFGQQDLPIVFTQHVNTPQDAGLMASWWRELITAENPLSEIIAEVQRSADSDQQLAVSNQQPAISVRKSQYDAFYQTNLEGLLRAANVTQVVICGVMTHLCCETTARSAFSRGFEVFFAVDGTATYNEHFHFASLLNLSHGFATPVLVAEILATLEERDEQD